MVCTLAFWTSIFSKREGLGVQPTKPTDMTFLFILALSPVGQHDSVFLDFLAVNKK